MFTGLIQEVGTVKAVSRRGEGRRLLVNAGKLAAELKTGDSVAVSGVCLTALEITTYSFAADLAAEPGARTSLAQLKPGSLVNLELPIKAGTPLGGHIVQGHVDGVGTLVSLEKSPGAEDWRLRLRLPQGAERYVVEKGSITIEGISLTVATAGDGHAEIAIIPHTYAVTNLRNLPLGAPLNIEVDILAKYAERMSTPESKVTIEKLMSEGF